MWAVSSWWGVQETIALRAWLGIVQAQRHTGNCSGGHLEKEVLYLAARPRPAVGGQFAFCPQSLVGQCLHRGSLLLELCSRNWSTHEVSFESKPLQDKGVMGLQDGAWVSASILVLFSSTRAKLMAHSMVGKSSWLGSVLSLWFPETESHAARPGLKLTVLIACKTGLYHHNQQNC